MDLLVGVFGKIKMIKIKRNKVFIFHILSLVWCFLPAKFLLVETPAIALTQNNNGECTNQITDETISQSGLTNPSFWWAEERFGGQMLDSWFACRDERQLYLVVNRQIWTLLDYVERYEFVNHFGNVARGYGYNIQVFNQQQRLLASYSCNFSVQPTNCNLWIDTIGKAGFQRPVIQK